MVNRREAVNVVTSTITSLIDDNFNETEEEMSETDVSSSDVFESDVSNRIRVYLDDLNIDDIEVGELCDSDDSRRLDSAHKSDSNGQNWPEFNPENDMSNPRLKVCKDGYRDGCRRIVGLDGCFLKGYYSGYLLATVGIDATNDIYPIAYTAVESENQASWLWFLELLTIDLEILSSYEISFITRRYVRHLHANFNKAGFRTKELKDSLWKASRASTPRDFEDVIDELKKTNKYAYDWLKEKNPTHWSRSHFSIRSHSDMLVNNLSESFNKMILEAKEKPILTMMETVRTKIMLLIVKKKEEAKKWKGMLCPKIRKKLDVNIKDSLRCVSSHASGNKYQVECGPNSQYVVNLVENSCSSRNWDLTSIPCIHVLAVIHLKNEFPETYVQTWYTKQTQLDIYSNFIRPVRGPKQWVSLSNMLPILPPTLRRPPGRPTKVKRHKVGVHNQVVAPTQQQVTPNQQEYTPT
ncbi:uncharacterized protein [Gossypium hirsutum]|uniref:SWIM-type domain-containing protein n=1 Tax=Gossypium hirsutum TaxID=3635 RepID=A0A1U8JL62_GOSHI|nr:uncharacterized protein LOC107908342 [Gossypium hirsutum]